VFWVDGFCALYVCGTMEMSIPSSGCAPGNKL
jgi:hypothetical protein